MKPKTAPTSLPRAYSYIRFSTPEQGKGDSLRRQVDAARTYAAALGLELDESLRDLGRSAYSGAHRTQGALGGFLCAVEGGEVPRGSLLIVESLDRLSREQVLDALEQFRAILKAGIEVVTLSDGQRYTEASVRKDFTQLLVSLLVMARAHEESARKAERVSAAWDQKRLRAVEGEAMTARCVAWCRAAGTGRERRYELIPERAAVVRRVFQETVDGMGRRVVVRRLNAEAVPTWGRSGGWQDSYIAKMLQNRAVMGFGQPHHRTVEGRVPLGEEVAGYYPEAIPPDLFHRANAARVQRRGKGGPQGEGVANLFGGLARCRCGATMVHVNKGAPPKGAGRTRLVEVLERARTVERLKMLAYISDVFEEGLPFALEAATALRLKGCRVIILHDTADVMAGMSASAFQAIADASGGCVIPFDAGSPARLRELLEALAVLAAGGLRLLQERRKALPGATLLLEHLGKG